MADEVNNTPELKPEEGQVNPEPITPVRSGLGRAIENTLKTNVPPTENKADTPPVEKKYDYSFFKDLKPEDYEAVKDYQDEAVRFKLLEKTNDVKKYQRLVSERETQLNQYKSAKPEEELGKYKEFIEGMKKDAIGTYKRFQKDFDLPEPEFLEKQVASGDVESRLEQWQEKDLVPNIERKHKIEEGTFTYDPSEAYKAGTPSYDYRIATEKRERELTSEFQQMQDKQIDIATKVKQQTDTDMKYLRETYFPNSDYETPEKADEAFVSLLTKIDENQEAIRKGEFNAELNPFALRNIFRGMNFDTLVQSAVDKATKSLHSQYNAKGLYLPNNETPTDATKLKGSSPTGNNNSERTKFSPMHRVVQQSLSSNSN